MVLLGVYWRSYNWVIMKKVMKIKYMQFY